MAYASTHDSDVERLRAWNLTLSGRVNRIGIDNRDRVRPGPAAGTLDGSYVFSRFNPAVGLTYNRRQPTGAPKR